MAISYVAVFYAPTVSPRLLPATLLRAFFHHSFVCAALSSTASAFATASLLCPRKVIIEEPASGEAVVKCRVKRPRH